LVARSNETFERQVDAAGQCERQQQRNQETTSFMEPLSAGGVTGSVTWRAKSVTWRTKTVTRGTQNVTWPAKNVT
jgi:hypothetical protein